MIGGKLTIGLFSLIYIQWEFFITSNDMIDDVDDWSMYVIPSMRPKKREQKAKRKGGCSMCVGGTLLLKCFEVTHH